SGCAIIRPPRDGGIRYRGLTQEQVQVLPVDYEIEYICRGSRVIVGPKVRKCLPDGTWTDLNQRSKCLLPCPRVWTSLENGRVTVHPPGPAVEDTILHYSCLEGFILVGRNSTHCTKLGKWDSPKPVCHCEYLCTFNYRINFIIKPCNSVILFFLCFASNADDRHYTGKNDIVFFPLYSIIRPIL
ncbi:hypothetical protein PO909_004739, partial [Leuciscus waleckii]